VVIVVDYHLPSFLSVWVYCPGIEKRIKKEKEILHIFKWLDKIEAGRVK
jgi:hypothetical protein